MVKNTKRSARIMSKLYKHMAVPYTLLYIIRPCSQYQDWWPDSWLIRVDPPPLYLSAKVAATLISIVPAGWPLPKVVMQLECGRVIAVKWPYRPRLARPRRGSSTREESARTWSQVMLTGSACRVKSAGLELGSWTDMPATAWLLPLVYCHMLWRLRILPEMQRRDFGRDGLNFSEKRTVSSIHFCHI